MTQLKTWVFSVIKAIICLFKGHKYNYSLAWGRKGGYDDVYIVCDRCEHPYFLKFHKSDIPLWVDEREPEVPTKIVGIANKTIANGDVIYLLDLR